MPPLHDAPSQSTCPKPVVETQIPTSSVTQTSPVKDFEVYRWVFHLTIAMIAYSYLYNIYTSNHYS